MSQSQTQGCPGEAICPSKLSRGRADKFSNGLARWGSSAFLGAMLLLAGCSPTVDLSPLPSASDQILVVLNGEPISLEEFDSEFRLMAIHYGAVSELNMRAIKRRLFDQIVDRRLLVQKALREGLRVNRHELEQALREYLKDVPAGFFDMLKEQGVGEEAWKRKMAQEVLLDKMAERDIYSGVKISDAEVEEYYWSHLDDFWLSEAYRARHLVVKTSRELSKVQASLKSGGSFAQACVDFSVDPQKETGGDWGWMPSSALSPSFLRLLRGLKSGEVSKPLKDGFGYHLFQLIEYRPTRVRSLKEAGPAVRDLLLKRERDRRFVDWLVSIKKTATVRVNPDLAVVVGIVWEDTRGIQKPSKKHKPVRRSVHRK